MSASEAEPALTMGIEPNSGEATSPPASPSLGPKDKKAAEVLSSDSKESETQKPVEAGEEPKQQPKDLPKDAKRKRVVVVGLGMVGIAFM